ncbi:MAG: hypothetical protein K9J12_09345 [Melioribacteraceae bacterium]|nr:hypothetical protein [Melioribacteraceae bacterium]MCF8266279.1 hypothetical protein [Melioribacteraceae bacterium]MCF8431465.1 hypothetical protein [Melioribacteraceae bacterium]
MENLVYTILTIVILLVVLELLELPDWIARKLRGQKSRSKLESELAEMEKRISALEVEKENQSKSK